MIEVEERERNWGKGRGAWRKGREQGGGGGSGSGKGRAASIVGKGRRVVSGEGREGVEKVVMVVGKVEVGEVLYEEEEKRDREGKTRRRAKSRKA